MKRIVSLILACITATASNETVVVGRMEVTPAPFIQTVEIRPRRIVIEYPDGTAFNPTVSAIYEKLNIRTFGTNSTEIVSRENIRMVSLPWTDATNKVPALAEARLQFSSVFWALFGNQAITVTNTP